MGWNPAWSCAGEVVVDSLLGLVRIVELVGITGIEADGWGTCGSDPPSAVEWAAKPALVLSHGGMIGRCAGAWGVLVSDGSGLSVLAPSISGGAPVAGERTCRGLVGLTGEVERVRPTANAAG